jgi:hypothetical protein
VRRACAHAAQRESDYTQMWELRRPVSVPSVEVVENGRGPATVKCVLATGKPCSLHHDHDPRSTSLGTMVRPKVGDNEYDTRSNIGTLRPKCAGDNDYEKPSANKDILAVRRNSEEGGVQYFFHVGAGQLQQPQPPTQQHVQQQQQQQQQHCVGVKPDQINNNPNHPAPQQATPDLVATFTTPACTMHPQQRTVLTTFGKSPEDPEPPTL